VDTIEIQRVEWAKEGLGANEAHVCRHLTQVIGPPPITVELDGNTRPNMGRPWELWREPGEPGAPLGEHLKDVPIGFDHGFEDPLDVAIWYIFMK
jgi:hypothetical protein